MGIVHSQSQTDMDTASDASLDFTKSFDEANKLKRQLADLHEKLEQKRSEYDSLFKKCSHMSRTIEEQSMAIEHQNETIVHHQQCLVKQQDEKELLLQQLNELKKEQQLNTKNILDPVCKSVEEESIIEKPSSINFAGDGKSESQFDSYFKLDIDQSNAGDENEIVSGIDNNENVYKTNAQKHSCPNIDDSNSMKYKQDSEPTVFKEFSLDASVGSTTDEHTIDSVHATMFKSEVQWAVGMSKQRPEFNEKDLEGGTPEKQRKIDEPPSPKELLQTPCRRIVFKPSLSSGGKRKFTAIFQTESCSMHSSQVSPASNTTDWMEINSATCGQTREESGSRLRRTSHKSSARRNVRRSKSPNFD